MIEDRVQLGIGLKLELDNNFKVIYVDMIKVVMIVC